MGLSEVRVQVRAQWVTVAGRDKRPTDAIMLGFSGKPRRPTLSQTGKHLGNMLPAQGLIYPVLHFETIS